MPALFQEHRGLSGPGSSASPSGGAAGVRWGAGPGSLQLPEAGSRGLGNSPTWWASLTLLRGWNLGNKACSHLRSGVPGSPGRKFCAELSLGVTHRGASPRAQQSRPAAGAWSPGLPRGSLGLRARYTCGLMRVPPCLRQGLSQATEPGWRTALGTGGPGPCSCSLGGFALHWAGPTLWEECSTSVPGDSLGTSRQIKANPAQHPDHP